MKSPIVLINRAKRPGAHSIEEIFESISLYNRELIIKYVPEYRISPINIFKNLIFSYINKGRITHITGDIHYISCVTWPRNILTIHDVGSINSSNRLKNILKNIFWIYIPTLFVTKITTISDFSRDELIKKAPWLKSKIVVIPNPVNPLIEYKPKVFNNTYPTILHLGTKRNKNLENTIISLSGIKCKLIIVGKLTDLQLELLKENEIDFENFVDLSYNDVVQLYYRCDIVSFLSFYEGFGMPVIEAQSVGRVLITSNITPIPSIAGKGAHYVDPNDIVDIKSGFNKIISSEDYRNYLITEGLKNVLQYQIENVSEKYKLLYEELLK